MISFIFSSRELVLDSEAGPNIYHQLKSSTVYYFRSTSPLDWSRQLFDDICVHYLPPVPPFDVEPLFPAAVKENRQTPATPSTIAEFLSSH